MFHTAHPSQSWLSHPQQCMWGRLHRYDYFLEHSRRVFTAPMWSPQTSVWSILCQVFCVCMTSSPVQLHTHSTGKAICLTIINKSLNVSSTGWQRAHYLKEITFMCSLTEKETVYFQAFEMLIVRVASTRLPVFNNATRMSTEFCAFLTPKIVVHFLGLTVSLAYSDTFNMSN